MIDYWKARDLLEMMFHAESPIVANSNAWVNKIKVNKRDISPAVYFLLPSNGGRKCYDFRVSKISYQDFLSEYNSPDFGPALERDVILILSLFLDQIDPSTAPGKLYLSEKLRSKGGRQ